MKKSTTMSSTPIPIDIASISSNKDLLRLAEEVKTTKQPKALTKDNETVAVLMPTGVALKPEKRREKTKTNYEAFLSAAGSWQDVDVEKFKAGVYESRRQSTKPPVNL